MGQLNPRLRFELPPFALGTLILLCGVALPARAQKLEVNLPPTATNKFTGGRQWAASPTGVALVTRGPWLVRLLVNQLWSLDGTPDGRQQINQTFVQAALTYATQTRSTLFMSTESTYDYTAREGPSRSSSASNNCCVSGSAVSAGWPRSLLHRHTGRRPDVRLPTPPDPRVPEVGGHLFQ
jgi:hypothetical protein